MVLNILNTQEDLNLDVVIMLQVLQHRSGHL